MIGSRPDIQYIVEAYDNICNSSVITEQGGEDIERPVISSIEIDSISNIETGVPETRSLYRSNNITSINADNNNLIVKGTTRDDDVITVMKNINNNEITIDVVSDNGANLFTYTGRNEGPGSYIELPLTNGRLGLMIKQQDV